MSVPAKNRLAVIFGAVCVALLVAYGWLFWTYGLLKIEVAFASEQTLVFEEMRARALQSDIAGAAGCLEYVVNYYPSGTKQQAGSRLDVIVERERVRAIGDIVAYLHAKTGENLGESPEPWIKKFAKQ